MLSASADEDTVEWHENDGPRRSRRYPSDGHPGARGRGLLQRLRDRRRRRRRRRALAGATDVAWRERRARFRKRHRPDLSRARAPAGRSSDRRRRRRRRGRARGLRGRVRGRVVRERRLRGLHRARLRRILLGLAPSSVRDDVDGGSDVDVVLASFLDDTVAWYENDESQSTKRVITTLANGASSVFAVDVDADAGGTCSRRAPTTPCRFTRTTALSLSTHVVADWATSATAVFAVDVDGDGDADVVSGAYGAERRWAGRTRRIQVLRARHRAHRLGRPLRLRSRRRRRRRRGRPLGIDL